MSPFWIEVGSLFSIMTLFHFIWDWLPQSEFTAVNKHKNAWIRHVHCSWYSLLMMVTFGFFVRDLNVVQLLILFTFLYITHFAEDTYWLPLMWLKHVRKATNGMGWCNTPNEVIRHTSVVTILMITVDQVIHLVCLFAACVGVLSF